MSSRTLVQIQIIPTASTCNIFDVRDVIQKMEKIEKLDKQQTPRISRYKDMLERGSLRYKVKPSHLPQLDTLYEKLPNFSAPLDDVKRHLALSLEGGDGVELTPLLLLGDPGIGKTYFAKCVSELICTSMTHVAMGSLTAGWILSGSSSQWQGAKTGKVFDALIDGDYANPVIVLDEIDKASVNAQYNPLGALYDLLEKDTAQSFVDEFAEIPIDASNVIWITTANDERNIPAPLLSRMNVFTIDPPNLEQGRMIAKNLYESTCKHHGWGNYFDRIPNEDTIDVLARLSPREMKRQLMVGFGNAKLAHRSTVTVDDLPKETGKKKTLGFLN